MMQIALFAGYTFALTLVKPDALPAIPKSDLTLVGWPLWRKCLIGIVPSAVLIFLVLGTMMMGLATPTEAGAMGAVGAVILAVLHHKELGRTGRIAFVAGVVLAGIAVGIGIFAFKSTPFRFALAGLYVAVVWLCVRAAAIPDLRALIVQAYQSTMRITAMVTFILIGSTCFSIVFQGVDGNLWVEHLLSALPGGAWGFLAFINVFVFFLAFFLDFFEIAFIIVPMLAPVAQKLLTPLVGPEAALIWFGVILCVNMQTSFMHPPFGFALFYLRSVAPKEIKTSDIYMGAIPFVLLQVVMVALVIAFPDLVTWALDKPLDVDLDKIELPSGAPQSEEDIVPPEMEPSDD